VEKKGDDQMTRKEFGAWGTDKRAPHFTDEPGH
jgi:hypothetical protein